MDNEALTARLYVSIPTRKFSAEQVNQMSAQFADNNAQRQINGYLYFNGHKFLQYLEGPTRVLDELMQRIREDDRHTMDLELAFDALRARVFPDWSMACLTAEDLDDRHIEERLEQGIQSLYADGIGKAKVANAALSDLMMLALKRKMAIVRG